MRAIILILILAVVALLIAIATGLININQTREARVPNVDVGRSGVTARGGQTPTFDIETGTVSVGTKPANVQVPSVQVDPASNAGDNSVNATANAG